MESPFGQIALLSRYILFRTPELKEQVATKVDPNVFYASRLVLVATATGFAAGAFMQGQLRGLQFVAENMHRVPKTKGGWYFYQRAKNNAVVEAAGIGGVKMATKFSFITIGYCVLDNLIEMQLGDRWTNPSVAGFLIAGGFSLYSRLSFGASRRALLVGTLAGTCIGLMQEGYKMAYGVSIKVPTIMLPKETVQES
ncbi:hypothetical protein EDD86DRAFT_202742 [Gorgonomyces haynaldii]|nr:hypothetical protein EDD86DRAFT_202742 [Gorgonomyces haynaldii]